MKKTLVFAVVGLLASGCFVSTNDPAPAPAPQPAVDTTVPANGTFTLDWTINGSTDPNQCNQSVASTISITVTTTAGASAGVFQQACQAFATSITLPPGSYTATAVMLDGAGQPRTTTVDVNPFSIVGNDEVRIPIDFPASSFF